MAKEECLVVAKEECHQCLVVDKEEGRPFGFVVVGFGWKETFLRKLVGRVVKGQSD